MLIWRAVLRSGWGRVGLRRGIDGVVDTAARSRKRRNAGLLMGLLEGRVLLSAAISGELVTEAAIPGVKASPLAAASAPLAAASLNVPVFNSNSGAKATLYLDFNGDAGGVSWGSTPLLPVTPAFDTDGDDTTFSVGDLASINEICARVAEKYSPFNVNVTTVDPGSYNNLVADRVVIGGRGAWSGGLYGGISYVGAFVNSLPNTGWVFSENLLNVTKYIAEAAAHEAGHMFGLQHQSVYDSNGVKTTEYFAGDDLRAPIMGDSYSAQRGLWWSGHPSTSATDIQNDVDVIASTASGGNGFGYRADEAGGTTGTAALLGISGNSYSASGVITTISDVDLYKFNVSTLGVGTFNLNVAAVGAMLDGKLQLMNSQGQVVQTVDTATLGETLSAILQPGVYYVAAESHGATGDIGQYTLNGTFTAGAPVTPNDPSNVVASVVLPTQIHLSWSDQSSNETGFKIERSTDGITWTQAGMIGPNSTLFDDLGVLPGTTYVYRVSAFTLVAQSGFATVGPITTWGGGTGLQGDYFNNADFTGATVRRNDATIDFNWLSGAPVSGIDPGTYSVRWTGEIQPVETGTYTFKTTADEGIRVWINGQLLIDRWSDVPLTGDTNSDGVVDATDVGTMLQNMGLAGGAAQGDFNGDGVVNFADFQIMELSFGATATPITDTGAIALQAGIKYDIKVEYFQDQGPASVKLEWVTPSGVREVVPQGLLFGPVSAALPRVASGAPALVAAKSVKGGSISAVKGRVVQSVFSVAPVMKPKDKLPRRSVGREVIS
jgi:hypothetical protein